MMRWNDESRMSSDRTRIRSHITTPLMSFSLADHIFRHRSTSMPIYACCIIMQPQEYIEYRREQQNRCAVYIVYSVADSFQ